MKIEFTPPQRDYQYLVCVLATAITVNISKKWHKWNLIHMQHIIYCQDRFLILIQNLKSEFQYGVCIMCYDLISDES